MKKKLALLLSAIMVVGMIPMTAFAVTTNEIDKVVTGTKDTPVKPNLTIIDKSLNTAVAANAGEVTFKLTLTNAEWASTFGAASVTVSEDVTTPGTPGDNVTVTKLSATQAVVEVTAGLVATDKKASVKVALDTVLKGEGAAEVTIDPMNSVVSGGTYKFGNVVEGATTTTIEKKTDLQENGSVIKNIVITETAAGSFDPNSSTPYFKLKLSNGFEFEEWIDGAKAISFEPAANVPVLNTNTAVKFHEVTGTGLSVTGYPNTDMGTAEVYVSTDFQEAYVVFASFTSDTTTPGIVSIGGLAVGYEEDDVTVGDIAEVTVSGYGMTKATVEVGTAVSYGVSITAENKTLPVFVAGREDSDKETLKVTFKETVVNSWLENRKTEITFPEGVKVVDVIFSDDKNFTFEEDASKIVDNKADYSVVTLKGTGRSGKVETKLKFELSIDPSFTGDIVATFGGAGLEEDVELVLGTVVAPITVEADTNEVSIDYRNVTIGDIVIKETDAGMLEKGKTLYLDVEELRFDGTPTVEVVEGDLKIDKVKVDKGTLKITIKTASSKTPAVLKVTDNELFLDRTIPAGSYALSMVLAQDSTTNAIFQNYDVEPKGKTDFDTDEVVVLDDFVEVVTAGRDQDDSTFTTTISVTIGADKLVAGKTEIALDVPAYISEGYTMLPVRAVTEALSGKAIVRWDDATKTVTITFGARVISMTVGSKTMNINGVAVQMAKACEITDSRAFIPLRDLGYALGLNDSKINWDDATKTATLN